MWPVESSPVCESECRKLRLVVRAIETEMLWIFKAKSEREPSAQLPFSILSYF